MQRSPTSEHIAAVEKKTSEETSALGGQPSASTGCVGKERAIEREIILNKYKNTGKNTHKHIKQGKSHSFESSYYCALMTT